MQFLRIISFLIIASSFAFSNSIQMVSSDEAPLLYQTKEGEQLTPSDSLRYCKIIGSIAIDSLGNEWIGMDQGGGLIKYDGQSWTNFNIFKLGLPDNSVGAIAVDAQGNKWIGTDKGLSKYDDHTWTNFETSNTDRPYLVVTSIVIDSQGNKWIGTLPCGIQRTDTGGGIAKFDGKTWTFYDTSNSGIPDNHVTAIAIDTEGNKWIGTYGGLAKFDEKTWTIYNRSNSGLPGFGVNSIVIDSQGNKWLGTSSDGLVKFDGQTWTIYNQFNSGIPPSK